MEKTENHGQRNWYGSLSRWGEAKHPLSNYTVSMKDFFPSTYYSACRMVEKATKIINKKERKKISWNQ